MSTGAGNCPECLNENSLVLKTETGNPDDFRWYCMACSAVFDETDLNEIRKKDNYNVNT